MYRFLDRPAAALERDDLFLLSAMRFWVSAVRSGRCPCPGILTGFTNREIGNTTHAFLDVMHILDRHSSGTLRFAPIGYDRVSDDEARLLALFALARDGQPLATAASALVADESASRIATSAGQVSAALLAVPLRQQ